MNKELFFLKAAEGDGQKAGICEMFIIEKEGDPMTLRQVGNPAIDRTIELTFPELMERRIPLSSINPNPHLFSTIIDHGSENQKAVLLAIPEAGVIVAGRLYKEDGKYMVKSMNPNVEAAYELQSFGTDVSISQVGRPIFPWVYKILKRNDTEGEYLVHTAGMSMFGHPELCVSVVRPNDGVQVLNDVAQMVYSGRRLDAVSSVFLPTKNMTARVSMGKMDDVDVCLIQP